MSDAQIALGIGPTALHGLVKSGRLETVQIGGRKIVLKRSIDRLLAEGDATPTRRGFNAREAIQARWARRAK